MSKAYVVIGLSYGDEAKGSTVDFLTRQVGAKLVVRFNGGAQAAHNVITDDLTHHTFSQFSAGSFAGAGTYLSRFMLVEPLAYINERQVLWNKTRLARYRMYVEESCPVITPFNWLANRASETFLGNTRHGSCGFGIGDLRADILQRKATYLTVKDLVQEPRHRLVQLLHEICVEKLRHIDPAWFCNEQANSYLDKMKHENLDELVTSYKQFVDCVSVIPDDYIKEIINHSDTPVIFEGAQGVLLDETHGFPPYNTWTDCTFNNANKLLEGTGADVTRIGCFRTNFTRHGAGPFPTESTYVKYSDHNTLGTWQGAFRMGYFDMVLAKYAIDVVNKYGGGPLDGIALSHLDITEATSGKINSATMHGLCNLPHQYDLKAIERGPDEVFTDNLKDALGIYYVSDTVDQFKERLGIPVLIESRGQCAKDKIMYPLAGV